MQVGQGREAEYHRLDGAGQPREGRREDEGGELVLIDAVPQRNGARLVVADRLQHLPAGGMDGAVDEQQAEGEDRENDVEESVLVVEVEEAGQRAEARRVGNRVGRTG